MTNIIKDKVNKISMTLLAVFAFVAVFNIWSSVIHWIGSKEITPVVWYGVKTLTPVVGPGGELVLDYDAEVNQQCPAELRAFIREADGSVVQRFTVNGGYTRASAGRKTIRVRLQIDDDITGIFPPLKNGPHTYEVIAIRFCSDGLKIDNRIPTATFNVKRE